ncbi:OmpA domain protein [Pseudooceanicola batsensis HTCC2597]|uniref:OmpA domain protein n=1 Tax=Pseudooceanicola batsensis (strain ATCC BAA-863 / DSM 15984 / KCTC 12145 / HTCC2597) TaxID=252305 RepID=A3TWK7_PSEBH|nr:substrate-binding domain-containing protein [Pseudooceanicola batsensis]EAQ04003.1 OmpA domain protein [Pseudooceanicola batsensis HTCC2597]
MTILRAVLCAALLLYKTAVPAISQDVTLTSRDGSVTIRGMLLGFDGEFYRVETDFGELTVDGSGVVCDGPGCPNLEAFVAELAISGAATTGTVLLPALVESFAFRAGYAVERQDEGAGVVTYVLADKDDGEVAARFSIRSSNTDEGFADLLANEADIVMALREIRPPELRRAIEAGMGNLRATGRNRVLALDALVPIVSPDNPVRALTLPQLAAIYAGEVDNWSAFGGPDAPIAPHLRDAESGMGQAVEDRLLGPAGAELSDRVERHGSDAQIVAAVVADPFAIGLTTASETGNAAQIGLSGACGFTVRATRRTAKTEDYPLTMPVFLYMPARRLPKLARDFLAYLRQPAAQLVIRRAGFVDQLPEEIPIADQGTRFANAIAQAGGGIALEELQRMVSTLTPYERLTVSFRFEAGSALLDAQSRSNIEQFAAALENGLYDGREVMFVGFSDGSGDAATNLRISRERARAVRRAVVLAAGDAELDRIRMTTDAFGEAMPMACDDSHWGRQVNRRVEVWIR